MGATWMPMSKSAWCNLYLLIGCMPCPVALQSLPLCLLSCYSGIVNGGGESSDRGVGVIGPVIPWYGTSDPVKGKIFCILSSGS